MNSCTLLKDHFSCLRSHEVLLDMFTDVLNSVQKYYTDDAAAFYREILASIEFEYQPEASDQFALFDPHQTPR